MKYVHTIFVLYLLYLCQILYLAKRKIILTTFIKFVLIKSKLRHNYLIV